MDSEKSWEAQSQEQRPAAGPPPRRIMRVFMWVVLAIVGVLGLAAIIIPNLLRSCRVTANQASAVGSLRTLNTAEITYSSTYNTGFSPNLAALAPGSGANPTESAAGLIDSVLASGEKSGYRFVYSAGPRDEHGRINSYSITASPIKPEVGPNYYYTDESGVIRQKTGATAGSTDSPLAG